MKSSSRATTTCPTCPGATGWLWPPLSLPGSPPSASSSSVASSVASTPCDWHRAAPRPTSPRVLQRRDRQAVPVDTFRVPSIESNRWTLFVNNCEFGLLKCLGRRRQFQTMQETTCRLLLLLLLFRNLRNMYLFSCNQCGLRQEWEWIRVSHRIVKGVSPVFSAQRKHTLPHPLTGCNLKYSPRVLRVPHR